MHRLRLYLKLVGFVLIVATSPRMNQVWAQVTVFSDTFDRPANNDIDASTDGMSGFVAPLTYNERSDLVLTANDGITNIESNQLHLADGTNATAMNLDFNFVSPVTTSLSVSLDLISNDGLASDGFQRFVGFGFGATAAEANGIRFDQGSSAASPAWKGHQSGTLAGSGVADFFVAWERDTNAAQNNFGTISFWKNGVRALTFDNAGSLYQIGSTLKVDLSFVNFNAGTTVSASVHYDGTLVGNDTFQWDNTNANYIGIAARQDLAGWTTDNFVVQANDFVIPSPPASPTLTIDRETGNVSLSNPTTEPIDIVGYVVQTTGGFDTSAWNNQAALERNFTGAANPSTNLAEGTLYLSGVVIPAGGELDLGDAWIPSPFEGFTAQFLKADDSFLSFDLIVTGNNDMSYDLGDFDIDGDLDPVDWYVLRSNRNTMADEDGVLAYRLEGDMNLDGQINDEDVALFAIEYDDANGDGAFADLIVPEPSAAALVGLSLVAGMTARRRSSSGALRRGA